MTERISNPKHAMDYPNIADEMFVVWVSNGIKWPDGRRYAGYLSSKRKDPLSGSPLFSPNWTDADVFDTAEEANAFLADSDIKRKKPYGAMVSDVWYLKVMCGYEPTQDPLLMTRTGRSFGISRFVDRSDVSCSIQISSLATEAAIWLGPDSADPKVLVPGEGWSAFKLPDNVITNTRMHLTREDVIKLLPVLENFARTGELE